MQNGIINAIPARFNWRLNRLFFIDNNKRINNTVYVPTLKSNARHSIKNTRSQKYCTCYVQRYDEIIMCWIMCLCVLCRHVYHILSMTRFVNHFFEKTNVYNVYVIKMSFKTRVQDCWTSFESKYTTSIRWPFIKFITVNIVSYV